MKPFLTLLLSFSLLASCQPSKSPNVNTTTEEPMQSIKQQLQFIVDSMYKAVPNTKGIAMHVEAPNLNISWTGAAGWADGDTKRELLPTDPALIASVTKTYVAAATLKLVESGKLALDTSIEQLLSTKTANLLQETGYNLKGITLANLGTHTSGIETYVDLPYFQDLTHSEPNRIWTRDEQIALAMTIEPKKQPDEFSYSETNYLLLTEIIEQQTGLPFYESIRELLGYQRHNLKETWWVDLEKAPEHLSPLVHQFAGEFKVESYTLSHTVDLFGGGGIAATPKDVALFTQLLFTGKLFNQPETKELLYHSVSTSDRPDEKDLEYYMGIAKTDLGPYVAYGHGGFWGTTTQYFPQLNASVSVFLMERDEWLKYREILQQVAEVLDKADG